MQFEQEATMLEPKAESKQLDLSQRAKLGSL